MTHHLQDQYLLGNVTILVQDEALYNADYYTIDPKQSELLDITIDQLRSLQGKVEDPERLIIETTTDGPVIYSRQPDAILSFAKALNEHMNVPVKKGELEKLRETLMIQQSNESLQ
jgi:hypothetical protein